VLLQFPPLLQQYRCHCSAAAVLLLLLQYCCNVNRSASVAAAYNTYAFEGNKTSNINAAQPINYTSSHTYK